MSTLLEPPPGKLVMSIFAANDKRIRYAQSLCRDRFGDIQYESDLLPFDYTDYYEKEFGKGMVRRFMAFHGLFPQDKLVEAKLFCHLLEDENMEEGRRIFNLDPGILTLERLVLSTGKNYTHRIYLGKGVFADLTLIFRQGSYRPLDWTYRDYADHKSIEFWNKVREDYRRELRQEGYIH